MQATLVHLLSEDLLDACGTAVPGGLELAPFTTPERITCPLCQLLVNEQHRQVVERDHAEALAENAAHDAATAAALATEEYLAADALAERPVQGVPMFGNRDLTTQPLTEREQAQVRMATTLAAAKLHQPQQRLPRAVRYGTPLRCVPPAP